jgi:Lrp/AsnC family transcriptional regulator, leucine-responsive regulatory protein
MKEASVALDDFDIRLLEAFQADAALSHAQLAELVRLSPSQVSRRLQRLTEQGVVRAMVGLLDPARVGLTCAAYVLVRLKDHNEQSTRAFRAIVERAPEITTCVALTGASDFLLKFVTRDLTEFYAILRDQLMNSALVAHVESSIVLEQIKETTALPLR